MRHVQNSNPFCAYKMAKSSSVVYNKRIRPPVSSALLELYAILDRVWYNFLISVKSPLLRLPRKLVCLQIFSQILRQTPVIWIQVEDNIGMQYDVLIRFMKPNE